MVRVFQGYEDMTCRILLAVPAVLLAACAPQTQLAPTTAPMAAATPSPAPEPTLAAELDIDATDAEAQALLVASAMSYLGKVTAEFDGMTMVVVEHDPDALLDEAFADPGFCAMVAAADAEPHDGVLNQPEAAELETAVLARLEG